MPTIKYTHLGKQEYGEAWKLQEQIMQRGLDIKKRRFAGEAADKEEIENHLLLCRHPHVYTLGKSGKEEHLLLSDERMVEIDATFYKTNRGGDITYHGPGQMVAYPVLDLEQFFTDLGQYMNTLEQVIIDTIETYGIKGERLKGEIGVWLNPSDPAKARKICAMGVRCSRWITIHGLALNINTDMSYFGHIVPCGIVDKGVTSMAQELGHSVDEAEVEERFLGFFGNAFGAEMVAEQFAINSAT